MYSNSMFLSKYFYGWMTHCVLENYTLINADLKISSPGQVLLLYKKLVKVISTTPLHWCKTEASAVRVVQCNFSTPEF